MRAQNRTIGLDKPCTLCGQPVHHTYQGPMEGICGRCADRVVKQRSRGRRNDACTVVRKVKKGGNRLVWFVLGLACGAATMYFSQPLVRSWIASLGSAG